MRFILCLLAALSFAAPSFAAACDFTAMAQASPLLQQGFTDSTTAIFQNPAEAQKARQVLVNVQRIFLHPQSKSILMYGWSQLPENWGGGQNEADLLSARMKKLKSEADQARQDFHFSILSGTPAAARFGIFYQNQKWPQREIGMEMLNADHCWLTVKLGGNKMDDAAADAALQRQIDAEFARLRGAEDAFLGADISLGELPSFNNRNFWAFTIPTLILALLAGIIIGKTAECEDNRHLQIYFRVMAGLWLLYVLVLTIFRLHFVDSAYTLSLEHFVYAAIMLVVQISGMILGPVLALPSVALALGHSIRAALFLMLGFDHAPRLVWFDVGLMTLMALYLLTMAFRRRKTMARPGGARPSVVDRNHS